MGIGRFVPFVGRAFLIVVLLFPILGACSSSDDGSDRLATLDKTELELEKLRVEIRDLEREADFQRGFWGRVIDLAPLVTLAVAVVGTFLAIWRQLGERAADRRERRIESNRQLDERFRATVDKLGSDGVAAQLGSVVGLRTFLAEGSAAGGPSYVQEVYSIVLAYLKLKHDRTVRNELVATFEMAARAVIENLGEGELLELDLSRADMPRVDLQGLSFAPEADLGFVNLKLANLDGVKMTRARGFEAQLDRARFSDADLRVGRFDRAQGQGVFFHDADLKDTHFKGAVLKKAQFHRAKLQAVHFNDADLRGARFEGADINDTYFLGAMLDEGALRSIARAQNWRKAHFDDDVRQQLERLGG